MAAEKFFGSVPGVNLFYIQEVTGPQSSSAVAPLGKAVLLPFSLLSPMPEQLFWNCSWEGYGCPAPGDCVDARLALDALETTASLALWMLHSDVRVYSLQYSFVSMARLRIEQVEDTTEALSCKAKGGALDEENKFFKSLGKALPPRRRARGETQQSRGKRPRNTVAKEAPDDQSSVASASESESDVGFAADTKQEWVAALEVAEADADADHLPKVVETAGEHGIVTLYFDPADEKRRWARQSVMKPGTPQESITMRCNLHGCMKCFVPRRFPSQLSMQRWLLEGSRLPRGAESRAAHLRMWPAA